MSLRSLFGLGATQADRDAVIAANARATQAHQAKLAAWQAAKRLYDQNVPAYQAAVARQEAEYAQALRNHEQNLAALRAGAAAASADYSARLGDYGRMKRAYDAQIESNRQAAARVLGQSPGPPFLVAQGFCVTKAQHDQWAWSCAPVRGLGAASDPICVWQNLPVCNPPIAPVMPRAPLPFLAPAPPAKPAPIRPPVDPGPPPKAPMLARVPALDPPVTITPPPPPKKPEIPTRDKIPVPPPLPPPPPFPEPEAPQQSFAVWGILAAVAVVGGGAYWYTHRKKAA